MTRSIPITSAVLACCLSAFGQARGTTTGFTSRFVARAALQTSGAKDLPNARLILALALANQDNTPEAVAEIRIYLDKPPNAPAVKRQLDSLRVHAAGLHPSLTCPPRLR